MDYQILPMGEVWSEGMFSVPSVIVNNYIRLASAYQLKALLVVLSSGGKATSRDISKATGVPESEICDIMSFWIEEGVLVADGIAPAPVKVPVPEKKEPTPATQKKAVEAMPVPTLSSQDINAALRENDALAETMRSAEEVLGRMMSHVERQLIVNMHNYYGLPCEVVLTIIQYYKTEKDAGKAIGTSYIAAMAKNWSEEGIDSLSAADEKLRDIEASDRNWDEIIALSGIRHRRPTAKQREMIKRWRNDFTIEMIALACDAMKENAERPSLKYVDSVLKNWKKKNIATPEDVLADSEKHQAAKNAQKDTRGEIEATYDLDQIAKDTMFNDNYDI